MADSCIISKEQLSQKELMLKSKLYGAAPLASTFGSQNRQTAQSQSEWRKPNLYAEKTLSSSPQKIVEHHKTQLKQVTDVKMDTFLDEMRQQFMQTQNQQAIPQSLLYQQTRMMEKQVAMLEQSQKSMSEVINNVMNQGATGVNSASSLKQQVFNENRRMLLEMMAPLSQQLNEMKLLYESTKSCSSDVGSKIDELKRVLANQSDNLNGPRGYPMMTQQLNPYQQLDLLDPGIMRKGIEEIKEQMRDAQREAHLIENDLQQRFTQMTMKNMQQRYLPQSITEEFSSFQHQLKEKTLADQLHSFPTMTQTKEAVLAKLGGYFDYPLCLEELRQIMSEKDIIDREFKSQALIPPDFKDKAFGKVPPYDFSTNSIFIKDPIKDQEWREKQSLEKPSYLQNLVLTEPKYFLDYDEYKQNYQQEVGSNLVKKTVTEYYPTTAQRKSNATVIGSGVNNKPGGRQTINQKQAPSKVQKRSYANDASDKSYDSKHSTPQSSGKKKTGRPKKDLNEIKKIDILSLKKQVIEEIKSEMELNKNPNNNPRNQANLESDKTRELEQQKKDFKQFEGVQMKGLKDVIDEEVDKQSQILNQFKRDNGLGNNLRQSTQSISSQQQPQLSQSLLENALADIMLSELNKDQVSASQDPQIKQIGEQMMIDKINSIFDEIARENDHFQNQQPQPTYQQQQPMVQQQTLPTVSNQTQVLSQQQPVVIPIVINQSNNQQTHSNSGSNPSDQIFKNPNQLRDMLSQVISAQLGMHNIRKDKEKDLDLFRESVISNDPMNQTSRTMQEEEAKLKAEQQELRKQTFINVQPYIQQTLNMGYQNPFAFSNGLNLPKANSINNFGLQQPLINDLDQFNMTSESSDFLSLESSQFSAGKDFFKSVSEQKGRSRSKHGPGARYSNLSHGDRSEGEVGAVEQSDDDISVGEIRYPGSTLRQSQQKPSSGMGLNMGVSSSINRQMIPPSVNKQGQRTGQSNVPAEIRKLGETIDYEDDKFSPEKDDEKPIMDSSDGPIAKPKQRFGQGRGGAVTNTGKSGSGNPIYGGSFGLNPYKLARGGMNQQQNESVKPMSSMGNRMQIQDNFLEEDEDELGSIRASKESGEIDPSMWK